MSKRKPGRPKEPGKRVRMNIFVRPKTQKRIDEMVDKSDRKRASRGKIVDIQFDQP